MTSLAIRLARHGCANRPFYHIVVIAHKEKRDADPIEQIGTYDPVLNKNNEKMVAVNFERLKYWLSEGAQPSKPAAELLGLSGFLPIHPFTYIRARRHREAERREKMKLAESSSQAASIETESGQPEKPLS